LLDISSILIGLITATPGIISLFLYARKMKKEEPDIHFRLIKSSYKLLKNKKTLILDLETLFENYGNANGSITDLICTVRYSPTVLKKYPFVSDMIGCRPISKRPENFNKIIPIEIPPYGARKMNLTVKFDNIYHLFLDRCYVALDLLNPKKWEWEDLPIHIQITIKYTKGTVTEYFCIFREDLPESKEFSGSITSLEEFEIERKFMPETKEEKNGWG